MHFEDIWNTTEQMAKKLCDPDLIVNIQTIKSELDKLPMYVNFPARQAEILGNVLFEICAISEKMNINVAAALRLSAENKKAEALDGDEI